MAEAAAKKAEKAAEAITKKAQKAAEAVAKKAEKEAEAAAKKAEAAAKKAEKAAEQRELQEQREREREDAAIDELLRSLPPSILDGSTDGDSWGVLVRRCAQAVASEYKQFAAALKPLHTDSIAASAFLSTWKLSLIRAYPGRSCCKGSPIAERKIDHVCEL